MSVNVRMSMLPGYNDCARRAAAKQFRKMIEAAGYTLRTTKKSAGAAVGTALHAAAAEVLRQRVDDPEMPLSGAVVLNAVNYAVEQLQIELADGFETDTKTKTVSDAVAQVQKMTGAILAPCWQMDPVLIEAPLKATYQFGETVIEATGTVDEAECDHTVWDFKTGQSEPSAYAQIGGYSLLLREEGYEPDRGGIVFVPRVRPNKPQPAATVTEYNISECEMMAWRTMESIARHVSDFEAEGEYHAFPANPMSQMCSPKYCPAHGTNFCGVGKKTTEDKE